MKSLVAGMTQTAALFEQTKKMLGAGHIQVIEDEEEVSKEFADEFYNDIQEEPPKPRVNRKERERGVLEAGKSENRGHGNEGFDQFVEKKEKPATTAKSEDWRCGECGAINGHLPSCKYYAKWKADLDKKSEGAPETGQAEPVKEEAAQTSTKQPESEQKGSGRELLTATVSEITARLKKLGPKQLKENVEARSKSQPEPHEPKSYYEITYDDGKVAQIWDTNLHAAILKSKGKKCVFAVTRSKTGYVAVEDIVEIGGVKFARDPATKQSIPAQILAATEKAIQNMEEGKTAAGEVIPNDWIEMSGLVDVFKKNSESGAPLMTSDKRHYVMFDLAGIDRGPESRFYCLKPQLFDCLEQAEFEQISFQYSTMEGNRRLVEDVLSIGNRSFRNGKPI
jgi:hypothetical protein